jgi:hypothetical protein
MGENGRGRALGLPATVLGVVVRRWSAGGDEVDRDWPVGPKRSRFDRGRPEVEATTARSRHPGGQLAPLVGIWDGFVQRFGMGSPGVRKIST